MVTCILEAPGRAGASSAGHAPAPSLPAPATWSEAELARTCAGVLDRLRREFAAAELAADAVQDALLSGWSSAGTAPIACLEAWLHTAARRRMLNHLRAERRRLQRSGAEALAAQTAAPAAEPVRTASPVAACLDRLGAAQQELLRWIYLDGLSYRDAAQRLGLGEGQLRGRVQRAKESLRSALRQLEID
jgi:RNA polymerase sigma-70 factor, ECF subfamily